MANKINLSSIEDKDLIKRYKHLAKQVKWLRAYLVNDLNKEESNKKYIDVLIITRKKLDDVSRFLSDKTKIKILGEI